MATALAAVSLTTADANWGGFYLRGGLGLNGTGVATTVAGANKQLVASLTMTPEIAVGLGATVVNAVYLGVDAQVGNCQINYVFIVEETGRADPKVYASWQPSVQARIALPLRVTMSFVAAGLDWFKDVSGVTDETILEEGCANWSVRIGSDFKVDENFFGSVYARFVRTFAKKDLTRSAMTTGFTVGYQF